MDDGLLDILWMGKKKAQKREGDIWCEANRIVKLAKSAGAAMKKKLGKEKKRRPRWMIVGEAINRRSLAKSQQQSNEWVDGWPNGHAVQSPSPSPPAPPPG